jgi:hypothetical protein
MRSACDRNRGDDKLVQNFDQKTTSEDTMLEIYM